jgi:cGMP-dependent protein kinase
VDNHGKVFLIDMGAAKELSSENMYRTFTIIGTPHYMAP